MKRFTSALLPYSLLRARHPGTDPGPNALDKLVVITADP